MLDKVEKAIKSGDIPFLQELLSRRDPNKPLCIEDAVDMNILHLTVGMECDTRDTIVKFLLKQPGLNINEPSGRGNDGWTAAHIAASWGYHQTLDILLKHGADPYITDSQGHNVWDIANAYDSHACVFTLESNSRKNEATILIEDDDDTLVLEDSGDSFISVQGDDNKVIHEDKKFNLKFIEDRPSTPNLEETVSCGPASVTLDKSILSLNDTVLRQRLIDKGESPGPIVPSTRDFYRRRLQRLQVKRVIFSATPTNDECKEINDVTSQLNNFRLDLSSEQCKPPQSQKSILLLPKYPTELNYFTDPDYDFRQVRSLEKKFREYFANSGHKNYFNYFLIDPRISKLDRGTSLTFDPELFKTFIEGIFYVGKGEGKRPLRHLYEAALLHQGPNRRRSTMERRRLNRKIQQILDIWHNGNGVVSLHCFLSISSDEALAREFLMIEALKIENLTNIQLGQNRIRLLQFNDNERRLLGSYFLYQAYRIFIVEGDNQIRLGDIRY